MCSSVINFVKENETDILENFAKYSTLNLNNLIYGSPLDERVKSHICDYIENRRGYIYECVKKGDIISTEDNFHYSNIYFSWDNLKQKLKQPPMYNRGIIMPPREMAERIRRAQQRGFGII